MFLGHRSRELSIYFDIFAHVEEIAGTEYRCDSHWAYLQTPARTR